MSGTRSLPRRGGGQLALAALVLIAATALLISAVGVAPAARELLAFRFDGPARKPTAAMEIAATNLQLVAASLLAARAVRTRPQLRLVFDVALASVLAINTAALGAALAAYGFRLLDAVALHGPLELAAFALAGGAYLSARAGELSTRRLAVTAVVAVALIAAAAVVEAYVQVGGLS